MRNEIGRWKTVAALPILAAAALLAFASASAQAQPSARAAAPHWTVNHGEVYCTLGRDNGPGAVNFALRVIPGTERVELLVTSRSWNRAPATYGQAVRIVTTPGEDAPIKTRTLAGRLPGGWR